MPKKVEGGVSLGALGLIGLSPAVRAARSTAGDSPISQGDKKTSAFFLGLGCALWSKFVRELDCLPGGCLGGRGTAVDAVPLAQFVLTVDVRGAIAGVSNRVAPLGSPLGDAITMPLPWIAMVAFAPTSHVR